jgi:hypothetical protein
VLGITAAANLADEGEELIAEAGVPTDRLPCRLLTCA